MGIHVYIPYFMKLSQHAREGTEENHLKPQRGHVLTSNNSTEYETRSIINYTPLSVK